MPLHHFLCFPNMILEGGSFDPHDPPGSAPKLLEWLIYSKLIVIKTVSYSITPHQYAWFPERIIDLTTTYCVFPTRKHPTFPGYFILVSKISQATKVK